jgi:putative transposase
MMPNHFHCIILNNGTGNPNIKTKTAVHSVVQWFKTMSTNEYIRGVKTLGWKPFDKKIWQRNFYEHIIRNDQSYQRIANYIANNPGNWNKDKFYE